MENKPTPIKWQLEDTLDRIYAELKHTIYNANQNYITKTRAEHIEKRLLNLQYLTAKYAIRAIEQSIRRAKFHQTKETTTSRNIGDRSAEEIEEGEQLEILTDKNIGDWSAEEANEKSEEEQLETSTK